MLGLAGLVVAFFWLPPAWFVVGVVLYLTCVVVITAALHDNPHQPWRQILDWIKDDSKYERFF